MFSSTGRRNASEIAELGSGDSTLSKESTIRAILLPKSESAAHSVQLEENHCWSYLYTEQETLPSPSPSDDEDDTPTSSPPKTVKTDASIAKTRRGRSQPAIVLKQMRENEKFTFGSSSNNDVVLKHLEESSQECCYINFLHLQLYPDPDSGALTLYNTSTSTFDVHSLSAPQFDDNVLPGQKTMIECGNWQLRLGKGLDFEIRVMPHTPEEAGHNRSLISPVTATTALLAKPIAKAATVGPLKEKIVEAPVPSVTRPGAIHIRNKTLIADRTAEGATTGSKAPPLRLQASHSLEPLILGETIGKTPHTQVFKAIRNDIVVAVKMCRKPEIKSSADTWRNELEILRNLNHPSIINLINYDAATLSLELEYIGPDLAQFVDRHQMSQLSENLRHRVWMDVSRGIEYIHSQDVTHFDVKPSNILLGDRAVLCDFGTSVKGTVKPTSSPGGTPCYVPPEYLYGNLRGSSGDIWAFGVTMLFVCGLIPLPRGSWKIAEVPAQGAASRKMADWVDEVERVTENIPEGLALLRSMLTPRSKERITAPQLVNKLLEMLPREPLELLA